MRRLLLAALLAMTPLAALADGPYRILHSVTPGGVGGFDYVHADPVGRRLYVARGGRNNPRIAIFDLDSLVPAGEIAGVNAHGVVVDPRTHHGFATSKPVTMFDTRTRDVLKTIAVGGDPDGALFDAFNGRTYILSETAPSVTAIDTASGEVTGTLDLQVKPEHMASDGKGRLFLVLNSADQVAVLDAKTLSVTARYGLDGKGGLPVGLALDAAHRILFVACRDPQAVVILNADTGAVLASFPIGAQSDGAVFNPATGEALIPAGDGTLTVVKENSPTAFAVEQTLTTRPGARTIAFDPKTGHIFLITADYAPPPPDAAPQRGRIARGATLPDSFTILEVGR